MNGALLQILEEGILLGDENFPLVHQGILVVQVFQVVADNAPVSVSVVGNDIGILPLADIPPHVVHKVKGIEGRLADTVPGQQATAAVDPGQGIGMGAEEI